MKNPHAVWAVFGIVICVIAGAVILILFDKPISDLLALVGIVAVPALGAFGVAIYQKMEQVKENSNGSITRRDESMERFMNKQQEMLQEMQRTMLQEMRTMSRMATATPAMTEEPKEEHAIDDTQAIHLPPSWTVERPT